MGSTRTAGIFLFFLLLVSCSVNRKEITSLAPDIHYENSDTYMLNPDASGTYEHAIILGTSGAPAIRAGKHILEQGGSAADAALATAMAQIVLSGGSWNSFAGIMSCVYYDSKTRKVYSMNAGYRSPFAEDQPLTIPERGGRTVLVPGFMAGVDALHSKFGNLPYKEIYKPALLFSEKGFRVYPLLHHLMKQKQNVLDNYQETREIFRRPKGGIYESGDVFKQPALYQTLLALSEQGSRYFYQGKFAEKFTTEVQREGGRLSLGDMENYRVIWSEPEHIHYRGYDVYINSHPFTGGKNITRSLSLMDELDVSQCGHYTESGVSFYWLTQILRISYLIEMYPVLTKAQQKSMDRFFNASGLTYGDVINQNNSQKLADLLRQQSMNKLIKNMFYESSTKNPHTDAIVAVDGSGNIAAIMHTMNAMYWGDTGLFVDGVSLPDSAIYHREYMAGQPAGHYITDDYYPLIVLKKGKPVLASSNTGVNQHGRTIQMLSGILDHNLSPMDALSRPFILTPYWDDPVKHAVLKHSFDSALLNEVKKLGQPIKQVNPDKALMLTGSWAGVVIHPETGMISGAIPVDELKYEYGHVDGD